MKAVLGHGVYTLSEAAKLVGVSPPRARAWFEGWPTGESRLLVGSDYRSKGKVDQISFLDLVDMGVVSQLRKIGVSMPKIRKVYGLLAKKIGEAHPFSRHELLVDSSGVFFAYVAQESGDRALTELFTGQSAIPSVLLPFLKRLKYNQKTGFVSGIPLSRGVAIYADRQYGKPIVESAGLSAKLLSDAYEANGRDAEAVADWYNVTPADVMDAVEFATRFTGFAA